MKMRRSTRMKLTLAGLFGVGVCLLLIIHIVINNNNNNNNTPDKTLHEQYIKLMQLDEPTRKYAEQETQRFSSRPFTPSEVFQEYFLCPKQL